jgi:predicted transcriptional regulator
MVGDKENKMKVYEITPTGVQVAQSMNYESDLKHEILVWINRRGGRCSDDQIISKLDDNRGAAMEVLGELIRDKAIQKIG